MAKANNDIRSALKMAKIPIWACAAEIGVHENTLLRKLRFELSDKEKMPIFEAIERIKSENKENQCKED